MINGRQDANSIVVVITDGQPMSPIRTGETSTQLKHDARLIWIPVGIKAKMDNFQNWASKPWEDGVLEIGELAELMTPHTVNDVISTICPHVRWGLGLLTKIRFMHAAASFKRVYLS